MSLLDLASWMEPLVWDYCTKYDKRYWRNPLDCDPKQLSHEQVNSLKTKRTDKEFESRAWELDIVTSGTMDMIHDYRLYFPHTQKPFRLNITNYVYETIIQQPVSKWDSMNIESWFRTGRICDFKAYEWFQSHDLIPDDFDLYDHALKCDDVKLFQLSNQDIPFRNLTIQVLIEKQCFDILEWVLEQRHEDCRDLFIAWSDPNGPND